MSEDHKIPPKFSNNSNKTAHKLKIFEREIIEGENCELGKGLKFHNWRDFWRFVQDIQDF